jgi:mRNA interferase HigB
VEVHILSKRRLREFWQRHPDAEAPLTDWFRLVRARRYASPHALRQDFPAASVVGAGRTVFNVGGNRYRLVVVMRYDTGRAYVLRVLTHQEYDRLGAEGRLWE